MIQHVRYCFSCWVSLFGGVRWEKTERARLRQHSIEAVEVTLVLRTLIVLLSFLQGVSACFVSEYVCYLWLVSLAPCLFCEVERSTRSDTRYEHSQESPTVMRTPWTTRTVVVVDWVRLRTIESTLRKFSMYVDTYKNLPGTVARVQDVRDSLRSVLRMASVRQFGLLHIC